jgi:hypothetical protein
MGVKLVSASAGSVEIVAPTTASNYTATLPAGTGTMVVNGINGSIVSGTAVSSTSGTSIDFTSIPSWVKRVTIMFNSVSTSGTSQKVIRIGTGSTPDTTGYTSVQTDLNAAAVATVAASGYFQLQSSAAAARAESGTMVLNLLNASTNIWTFNSGLAQDTFTNNFISFGSKTLSGSLGIVRVTTAGGTDTFDLGSINILYE